jgi:LEA14-like dessication related protein
VKRRLRLLSAALPLVLVSCTTWKKPTIAFEGVSVLGFGSDGAKLEVLLRVDNPNSYRLVVRHFTYRLSVEGASIGGGEADSEIAVEAKSSTDARLPVALDWRELKHRGARFLLSGGADYAVEGKVTFSTPIGTFSRPYGHTGRVGALPE